MATKMCRLWINWGAYLTAQTIFEPIRALLKTSLANASVIYIGFHVEMFDFWNLAYISNKNGFNFLLEKAQVKIKTILLRPPENSFFTTIY